MKPHKWAKEIKAWADGAEIETTTNDGKWITTETPQWITDSDFQYRIKPQPKEPQYLYVYNKGSINEPYYIFCYSKLDFSISRSMLYVGKIKLENEDE